MIKITKLDGKEVIVNAELIKFIEATPDTVISLTSGCKLVVKEETDVIIERVVKYKRKINRMPE